MLEENIRDAKEIMQNILTQTLRLHGATETSLLKAAQEFDRSNPLSSDLRKIVLSFIEFPEETESMLREMDLLADDLLPRRSY